MSVREEDRRKNNCSSRGLGLAAAAIGVGVGAALYYFFNKRPENPDTEGATSGNWSYEEPRTLTITSSSSGKSGYITISEHTTTDASINLTDKEDKLSRNRRKLVKKLNFESESDTSSNKMDSSYEDNSGYDDESCFDTTENEPEEELTLTDTDISNDESTEDSINSLNQSSSTSEDYSDVSLSTNDSSLETGSDTSLLTTDDDSSLETGYVTLRTTSLQSINNTTNETSDSEMDMEWDITSSSADVPTDTSSSLSPFFRNIFSRLPSPRLRNTVSSEDAQTRKLREQAFRERRWSLEECSICFDVMLQDQQLMQLPCTHNFHVACIGPWLQEHQTCPMCRKRAE